MIHVVPLIGVDEVVRKHGVEQFAADVDAMPFQYADVVFEVLSDFADVGVFEKGNEFFERLQGLLAVGRKADKPGFVGLDAEGYAESYRDGKGPGALLAREDT